tara:strand:+ start:18 stop:125 length:108 start_codon:yes stop_codon:yes gene_type:complete
MPFFGGQLVVSNVERDEGTLEKEFYVGETISALNK